MEKEIGTDPYNPDTDGDGLTDGEEVLKFHTDPLNPDTDGDGLSDAAEANVTGTSPTDPDSDGDGLPDGLPGLIIRPVGHRAGVKDVSIGLLSGRYDFVSTGGELGSQGGGIGLVGLTAEGDQGDFQRVFSIHPPPNTSSPR